MEAKQVCVQEEVSGEWRDLSLIYQGEYILQVFVYSNVIHFGQFDEAVDGVGEETGSFCSFRIADSLENVPGEAKVLIVRLV